MLDKTIKQEVMDELLPELANLVENLPQYGEIRLKAKICDYKVGTISSRRETSKRILKSS